MRCVIQRVSKASVQVENETIAQINHGILALVGIGREDSLKDLQWMAEKLSGLRIFEDEQGKMNLSLLDVQGEMLLVSQFTLYGDCRKGKRPSFTEAAAPQEAEKLFNELVNAVRQKGIPVKTGKFQAEMAVELINQGPVTIILDSNNSKK
ncbi:MAG: D-tyrosyl-tRNA(Tyr) deacylase [Peptococcaceae bacterium]|nr:D-tyrosyl-tRNA(Tyr) deacylase [Peptococcaceae bacterium]